jgi:1-acyl-sn-glycerol-3-phosphate acyltransferase
MKYLIFLPRAVFSVYAFLLFIIIMFLVFPLVVAASFFGKIKGGNFIYGICRLWTDAFLPLCGIFHSNIYEVPHDTNKQFVFVFNHISYLDIPVIMKAIRKQHFRILGKAELGKVPVFGFLYRNAVVLVDRTNVEKRAKSVRQLKSVINKGISVVIAPEGTFNTTHQPLKDFYDGAFKVAIETQTPVKPILFLDTYNRLNYKNIFSLTPGKSRAVFLEEVGVDGMTLKDVQVLKKKVYKLMEKKLIDYKASWIASAE